MGNWCGRSSNNEVDRQLEREAILEKLKFKCLLLGSGESGKSTVLKGLKLIYKIKLSEHDIRDITHSLRSNALSSMQILIEKAHEFEYEMDPENSAMAKALTSLELEAPFNQEIASNIIALWQCPSIRKAFNRRKEFWILEAVEYYFNNIERIADEDYQPTEEDTIMARVMTTGIITTKITQPPLEFAVVDVGGQRTERRKWMHVFDNVDILIYVVNLAGYNSCLFEDQTQNRMKECFTLFQQTVNNPIFSKTPVFLLLNKKDLFETKLREDPITSCEVFSDYSGTKDVMECIAFVEQKFKNSVVLGDPSRVKCSYIAARYKKDVKGVWDEITGFLKEARKKEIETAVKILGKGSLEETKVQE